MQSTLNYVVSKNNSLISYSTEPESNKPIEDINILTPTKICRKTGLPVIVMEVILNPHAESVRMFLYNHKIRYFCYIYREVHTGLRSYGLKNGRKAWFRSIYDDYYKGYLKNVEKDKELED